MVRKSVFAAALVLVGSVLCSTQPLKAAETCTEVGRGKICSTAVNSGLNLVTSISVTVPADGALAVIKKYGVNDTSLLYACRITANNRESHTEAVFARAPAEVILRMNDAPFVGGEITQDKRMNCKFEARTLTASSGPYEYHGDVPKEIAPCAQKLLGRINAGGLTVKKQTNSTMFFQAEHDEFTSRCALYKDAVTGAISGPKLCKPTLENLKPLLDMVGTPEKDYKKVVELVASNMRKAKRKNDQITAKKNDYEVTVSATADNCIVIVYSPESATSN